MPQPRVSEPPDRAQINSLQLELVCALTALENLVGHEETTRLLALALEEALQEHKEGECGTDETASNESATT